MAVSAASGRFRSHLIISAKTISIVLRQKCLSPPRWPRRYPHRAGHNAVSDNLGLEFIRPSSPARGRVYLETLNRHPSRVVRMVVHCEYCPIKGTGLYRRQCRRLLDQKGGGALPTAHRYPRHFPFNSREKDRANISALRGIARALGGACGAQL